MGQTPFEKTGQTPFEKMGQTPFEILKIGDEIEQNIQFYEDNDDELISGNTIFDDFGINSNNFNLPFSELIDLNGYNYLFIKSNNCYIDNYNLPIFDEDFAISLLLNKYSLANPKNYKCHKCGSCVKFYSRLDKGKLRKVLRCKKKGCQTTQSMRKNFSLWTGMSKNGHSVIKLNITTQLELAFYWCQDFSANMIANLTGKSKKIVNNWIHLFQEVPLRMFDKRTHFGGPGKIILIDYCSLESLIKKKKNHYDKQLKSYWLVVLCTEFEERYFLLETKDKTAIHTIIKQEITAGSILHADKWVECNKLTQYHHCMISHNEPGTNESTQKIKSLWKPLTLFLDYKCSPNITPVIISRFLTETWWRSKNKFDLFEKFIEDSTK